MYSEQTPSSADGEIPVFAVPNSINFYADDPDQHKQIITLFNPYKFPVKFKVLSNCPKRYAVADNVGTLKPKCCVDIVVRHTAVLPCNYGVTNKIRIAMSKLGTGEPTSKKDVKATLFPTKENPKEENLNESKNSQQLPPQSPSHSPRRQAQQYNMRDNDRNNRYIVLAIIGGLICIFVLLLPTEGETSIMPPYLHLVTSQKLCASYVLGFLSALLVMLLPL